MTGLQYQNLDAKWIEFIRKLFFRATSAFLIIFGRRETGKTDFSLLISETLYQLGFRDFATNIDIINDLGLNFKIITNLEDLRFWAQDRKERKLFIFDEVGKTLRRRSPMSSLNIRLIDELQVLRKYKLSIIACTPAAKFVDSSILGSDILDGAFKKPWIFKDKKENQKIALYEDKLEDFYKSLDNIPGTNIKFNTWGTAPFTEYGPTKKPKFKDKELDILWKWSHGKTAKELNITRMQIHRISIKFIKEVLERESNK